MFDVYGPRVLVGTGSVLFVLSLLLVSFFQDYNQLVSTHSFTDRHFLNVLSGNVDDLPRRAFWNRKLYDLQSLHCRSVYQS